MNVRLFVAIALLAPFILFSADIFDHEAGPDASEPFVILHDVVELKNYLQEDLHVRFLDDRRRLIAPEEILNEFIHTSITPFYDYVIPAAQGTDHEELGYVRIKLPKNILSKTFTIIIFLATKDDYGNTVKAKDLLSGQELRRPIAQFTMQPDPERKRCLVSIERSNGKVVVRPQKGRKSGGERKTISGIPKERNVKTKDIGKNVIR